MPPTSRLRRFVDYLLSFGSYEGESPDQKGRRRIIVGALWVSILPIALAAVLSSGTWLVVAGAIQTSAHFAALILLRLMPHRFAVIINLVFAVDIASDVGDSILLGGLFDSGLAVVWSLIGVLGSLVALSIRAAVVWFGVFVAAVGVTLAAPSIVDPIYELSDPQTDGAIAIVGMTLLVFAVMAYFVRQRNLFQQQSDTLLNNVLPSEIAERLKRDSGMIAEQLNSVSVLFADVVDFTPMSSAMSPTQLVGLLDRVFSDIDGFVEELGLEKIKTVGDEYMVAAGVPTPRSDHAEVVAELALRIRDHFAAGSVNGHRIEFRIGINSGPVVAGIIGRRKFAYDLWGDVVNTASRMESQGVAGEIQITGSTFGLISDRFLCKPRGTIDVKGKGEQETWLLRGRL
ncbi:MAG: adenylate/guanylate cyclase domain-containing protein [Acidimicrobiia bacterium]|nr:adenylate/guanylate cyclase domain-containing protein [Acidimicrobiia bacterium]